VAATYTYDPYGNTTGITGTVNNPLRYSGAYTDLETGLLYLINRYYDPRTAQFLNVDPLVSATSRPYGYAGDNPLNAIDPIGLFCYRLPAGAYGPPDCPAGPPNPNDPNQVATPQEAMTPAAPTEAWVPRAAFVAQGDSKFQLNTGEVVGIQIVDLTFAIGGYEVRDSIGEHHEYGSVGLGTSGIMTFHPAFGQTSYEFDIQWNPLPLVGIDDYPDATYGVIIYSLEETTTTGLACGVDATVV
jgi:RHS repeat-associated protein